MIHVRSIGPAARLLGAFVGVGLGGAARALDHASTALLRRI